MDCRFNSPPIYIDHNYIYISLLFNIFRFLFQNNLDKTDITQCDKENYVKNDSAINDYKQDEDDQQLVY